MAYAMKLSKPQKIKLSDFDPDDTGKAKKSGAESELLSLGETMAQQQELLYAAQTHSVLIVLQGLDTSGKDGTISHVMSHVNPQGCAVASFKVPTPEEAAHDFLWRVHKQTPVKGSIAIFNRSHYEDVLVARVHHFADDAEITRRYALINQFEQLLSDENTIILKFFLHITKDEQKKRLLAREEDPAKAWKLSAADWHEREFWDDYTSAYEAALGATAAETAPWYVVPANHKWFRNLAIAETLTKTLHPYEKGWQEALKKIGEQRKAELAQMRAGGTAGK